MTRWWEVMTKAMIMISCETFICLNYNLHSNRHAVAPVADRHLNIDSEILKQVQDDALVEGHRKIGDTCPMQNC